MDKSEDGASSKLETWADTLEQEILDQAGQILSIENVSSIKR